MHKTMILKMFRINSYQNCIETDTTTLTLILSDSTLTSGWWNSWSDTSLSHDIKYHRYSWKVMTKITIDRISCINVHEKFKNLSLAIENRRYSKVSFPMTDIIPNRRITNAGLFQNFPSYISSTTFHHGKKKKIMKSRTYLGSKNQCTQTSVWRSWSRVS